MLESEKQALIGQSQCLRQLLVPSSLVCFGPLGVRTTRLIWFVNGGLLFETKQKENL